MPRPSPRCLYTEERRRQTATQHEAPISPTGIPDSVTDDLQIPFGLLISVGFDS